MARKAYQSRKSPLGPIATHQRSLAPRIFWACMVLACACIAVILWLVITNVPVREFGIFPRIFVIVLLGIFTVASLASTEVLPWSSRSWAEWRRPKVLGTIIYLVLGAAGFVAGIVNAFDPPADKRTQNEILDTVNEVAGAVGIGRTSLIRANIERTWGELGSGCTVTYQIKISDMSLELTSLLDPPGEDSIHETYSIISDGDRVGASGEHLSVLVTTEKGGLHDGQTVTFNYYSNGKSAWLEWIHSNEGINLVRLGQC
jgi:hypothetical protein